MNTETDRDCRRAADLIPWVAGGAGAADDKVWLYLHVAGCERCRTDLTRALALAVRVRQAAGSLPAVPAELWHSIATAAPVNPDPGARATVLITKALRLLGQAGLPGAVSAQLQWALSWV